MSKTHALRACSIAVLMAASISLAGCSISIRQPANGADVALNNQVPSVHVVVTGNASYTNLRVMADGTDVSSQMASKSSSENDGDLQLARGQHTLTASADVQCWYCSGQTTHSSATTTFQVLERRGK